MHIKSKSGDRRAWRSFDITIGVRETFPLQTEAICIITDRPDHEHIAAVAKGAAFPPTRAISPTPPTSSNIPKNNATYFSGNDTAERVLDSTPTKAEKNTTYAHTLSIAVAADETELTAMLEKLGA